MSRRGTAFISGVAVVDCRKAVAPEFNSAKRKRDSVKTNFLSGRLMSIQLFLSTVEQQAIEFRNAQA